MNRRRYLLLLVPFLLLARTVEAGNVENRERTARMACLSGDYAKGVALLSELFVDTQDPNYIFNQARCFQQNLLYAEAIARFQEFLRAARKASRTEKAEAEKHIADCQDLLAKQATSAATSPTPAPTQAPEAAAAVVVATPSTPTGIQHTNSSSESGAGLRTAGIVTIAVGGAALVAGILLNLKVNSMASDLQKIDGYSASKESDRKTYVTLGWVGYGAGAACVATGAVLYYLGRRSSAPGSTSVALVPAFAAGQTGAVLKGAF
jgi:hypothetical protein